MQILVVKTSSLGDLFHALPTVHLLKKAFNAEMDWVVNTEYTSVAKCFTDVRRIIPFPRRQLCSGQRTFLRELRAVQYDLVVDLQGLMKSALICRAARRVRDAKIIGPSFQREGAHWLYSAVAGPKNKQRHAVEENLDVLRWLGKPVEPVKFPVRFPAFDFQTPGKNFQPLKDAPLIVFAPCSRHTAKNWPPERFAELGRRMDMPIVLVGAPADVKTCTVIASGVGRKAVNLAGKTSLVELGGILQAADLVVTVDSGPMHIAAAIGTPCVAIFGPTDPLRVGPYGSQHRVLRDPSLQSINRNYSRSDIESIRKVSVDTVFSAVMEMLSKK